MAGIRMYQEQLPILYPHSFAAIQKLVMAMADFEKNIGKRSLFGRDKGAIAYEQFLNSLRQTVTCMTLDCKIRESSSVTEVVAALEELLTKFSMAYPNWEDAYKFANHFFSANNREDYTAVINRIRSRGDSPPPDDTRETSLTSICRGLRRGTLLFQIFSTLSRRVTLQAGRSATLCV